MNPWEFEDKIKMKEKFKEVIKKYFENLSKGNYKKLINLFSERAIVYSPLYGKKEATGFYKELIEDSNESSKVELIESFVNKDILTGAGNFKYSWTLKNGKNCSFEGVDLFKFNKDGKIVQVKIIYDTSCIRNDFEKMKK